MLAACLLPCCAAHGTDGLGLPMGDALGLSLGQAGAGGANAGLEMAHQAIIPLALSQQQLAGLNSHMFSVQVCCAGISAAPA